jgi:hypothetical protein
MAISPLMTWDAFGTPQAHRLIGGTALESVQLGAATGFTAATYDTATRGRVSHGRMAEFRRNLYLNHRGTIYQFNFGTKTWVSTGYTVTGAPTNQDQAMGALHVMDVPGQGQTLVMVYRRISNNNVRATWSVDGTTWTESPDFNTNSSPPGFELPYQGKLWCCGSNQNGFAVYSFDPLTKGWATYPIFGLNTGNLGSNAQLLNFQGRLFWAGCQFLAGFNRELMQLKELVGGGFIDVPISGGTTPGLMATVNTVPGGAVGMFEDAGNMYVVFHEMVNPNPDLTTGALRVFEFVPNSSVIGGSFAENDLSTTVVPVAFRAGGGSSAGSFNTNIQVHVDTSVPGSPQVFWWRYADPAVVAASTFFTWNGNAVVASTAAGQSRNFLTAVSPNSTGERIYTEGDWDVTLDELRGNTAGADARNVRFEAQIHQPLDSSTPAAKQGRLFYSVGGSDWQVATLSTAGSDAPSLISGAGPAPTISGNLLQNILVNGDRFDAVWDAVADGVTNPGDQPELMLDVF